MSKRTFMIRFIALLVITAVSMAALAVCKNSEQDEINIETPKPESSSCSVPESSTVENEAESSEPDISGESSTAKEQREPVLTLDISKEPIGFERHAAPDFLTEEQQTVYKKAYELSSALLVELSNIGSYPFAENQEKREISAKPTGPNGDYYRVQGRYSRWDDLHAVLLSFLSEEYLNERWGNLFISDEDGNALVGNGSRGTNIERTDKPDGYELIKQTETEIEFNVIGYFKEVDENGNHAGTEYTSSFPNKMVLTESGWRMSLFAISR